MLDEEGLGCRVESKRPCDPRAPGGGEGSRGPPSGRSQSGADQGHGHMFSELCRETLRRALAHTYLGYIISLRDQLDSDDDAEEIPPDHDQQNPGNNASSIKYSLLIFSPNN